MAHHTLCSAYQSLAERLDRFPQGAPPSETLYRILAVLFSEHEAALVARLPIKPFTARQAARVWQMDLAAAQSVLEGLASRAILVDVEQHGEMVYTLPPPMAGFFEFSLMRLRGDVDQRLLSELFYQYLTVEDDFFRALFRGQTQLGRAFVQEPALPAGEALPDGRALHVLDYERASQVIRTAPHMGVGMCYCRHKMQHLDRACGAPMDICMTFGQVADALIRHGYARRVGVAEGLELLQQAYEHNLVQFGENAQSGVSFICNCCGCCCEAMIAARRFAVLHPIHTTNWMPHVDVQQCTGCGQCVTACPVEAMALVSANDPHRPKLHRARVDEEVCLGCGVCVRTCTHGALALERRPRRVITPVNGLHRIVVMAVERGGLQDLIFDNRALFSHRALAAVLGAILRLPPLKQVLANQQVKSRYLAALLEKVPV